MEITESEFTKNERPNPAFWGLNDTSITLLELITYYYNGNSVQTSEGERSLGQTMDPQLDELLTVFGGEYEDYETAHERLLKQELLSEQTVCRKPIEWAPTEKGLRAIRDVIDPKTVFPDWAEELSDGPIFGDPNETLLHRKGVQIAGELIPLVKWTWDISEPGHPNYGVEWYPDDSPYDLLVDTVEHQANVGVEVITSTHNHGHLLNKFKRATAQDRVTLWIFGNRRQACEFFNAVYREGYDVVETPFKRQGNWSAQAINRKVWREWDIEQTYNNDSQDIVQTVTGLLNYDEDDVHDLFQSWYSRNDTSELTWDGG